ncbi:MAG: DUF2189 domain-containing protein, partial [Rhodobiaceae bacterium]|nr:DUF2189 domain-containing protein [Rhodobiaceae bacterium]
MAPAPDQAEQIADGEDAKKPAIVINDIEPGDIVAAYRAGLKDFFTVPAYGLFFGAVYFFGGVFILVSLMLLKLPFLAFPMAVGFAMIAPFVAGGLYEISRRLERGEYLSFGGILTSVRGHVSRDLGWMALVTTFAFYIWTDFAGIIYLLFFGLNLMDPMAFVKQVFLTPQGWMFLALGNSVGAVVSLIVFSITAISFPLLHDHDFDFVTAMITSVKTVIRNPAAMIVWCLSIVVVLGV